MKTLTMMALAAAALGSVAPASAQREPAERGLRLEHDELRNNEIQKQLTRPADTGLLPPAPQPSPRGDRKTRQKKQQN
jgi:hypothetical protein